MTLKIFSKLFSKNDNTKSTENKEVEDFKNTLVKLPDVKELYGDSFDTFIDTAREKGLYEEIPFFGNIIRITKKTVDTYSAFNSYGFCKKAYSFLVSTKDIGRDDIEKFMQEYSGLTNEDGYEALLSVINRIDSINKVFILGNLFKAKCLGLIEMDDYIRLSNALEHAPFVDLALLPTYINEKEECKDSYSLFAAGLLYESTLDVDNPNKYQLNENGKVMTEYGLGIDVKDYKKGSTKVKNVAESIPLDEIDKMTRDIFK